MFKKPFTLRSFFLTTILCLNTGWLPVAEANSFDSIFDDRGRVLEFHTKRDASNIFFPERKILLGASLGKRLDGLSNFRRIIPYLSNERPPVYTGGIEEGTLRAARKVMDKVSLPYRDSRISDLGKGYSQGYAQNMIRFEDLTYGLDNDRRIRMNYFASVEKVKTRLWADGSYAERGYRCHFENCKSRPVVEWAAGATFNLAGIRLTGYYSDRQNFDFNSFSKKSGMLRGDIFGTYYPRDGYRFSGSYVLNAATRFGFSFGSGDLDFEESATKVVRNNFERSLWTVGVYHDVSSWLRIVAEYNRTEIDLERNSGQGADTISVGGVLFW